MIRTSCSLVGDIVAYVPCMPTEWEGGRRAEEEEEAQDEEEGREEATPLLCGGGRGGTRPRASRAPPSRAAPQRGRRGSRVKRCCALLAPRAPDACGGQGGCASQGGQARGGGPA